MNWRKFIIPVITLAVIGGIFVYEMFPSIDTEKFVGIEIPEQATNVHYAFNTWLYASARFEFEIASTGNENFMKQLHKLCFDGNLSNEVNLYNMDYDCWTP